MKSLIFRHTEYHKDSETTTIHILGVCVFKRVIIDYDEERKHRACGFQQYASDAHGHFTSEFDDEDDE